MSYSSQRRAILNLLGGYDYPGGLTRLQIAYKLGIERATICRRVAELKEMGQLWVVRKGLDPITDTRAEFLTTNKRIAMSAPVEKKEQTGHLF